MDNETGHLVHSGLVKPFDPRFFYLGKSQFPYTRSLSYRSYSASLAVAIKVQSKTACSRHAKGLHVSPFNLVTVVT